MNLDVKTLFDTLLGMFIPMIVGVIAAKCGVITSDFSKRLSNFVLNIAQPFLIVASIVGMEYSSSLLKLGFTVILVGVIVHGIAAAIAFLSTCKIKDEKARRVMECCTIFSNCGFFGFPLLKAIYGDVGVFMGGFYMTIFNLTMWSYGVFILSRGNKEERIKWRRLFINGGTIPCAIGLVLYLLRVPVYPAIQTSMQAIGNTCTPLSMFVIGGMIANMKLGTLLLSPLPYYSSLVKQVLLPILTALALRFLGFDGQLVVFGALMIALPIAAANAMFAETYDVRPDLAAQTVGISTLLSLLTIPLVMQLVRLLV